MNTFLWPVRVYYEDTDAGGVVFYANYLKFMERARTEWLRQYGLEQDELIRDHGVIFAVRSAQVEYLQPARFNDELEVSVQPTKIGRASFTFDQQIRRKGVEASLCTAVVRVASLDAHSFRPCPVPARVREKFAVD